MNANRSPAGNDGNTTPPPAGDPVQVAGRAWLARLRREERGAALAEFALVLPVLLLLLLGMVDFGKAINYWIDETHLANEGARLAVVNSNPASVGPCGGAGGTLQAFILQQAETAEQRGCVQGTQRTAPPGNRTQVAICFYDRNTGQSKATSTAVVGDTVVVFVTYNYEWLRGFPFPGNPVTEITGKAAMRLEAKPTTYDTSANTRSCPTTA